MVVGFEIVYCYDFLILRVFEFVDMSYFVFCYCLVLLNYVMFYEHVENLMVLVVEISLLFDEHVDF